MAQTSGQPSTLGMYLHSKLAFLIIFIAALALGGLIWQKQILRFLVDTPSHSIASLAERVMAEPTPTPLPSPKLLFLGDLMYDRNIRARTEEHGARWPLARLEPLMQQHDLVVANLEGPITSAPSTSRGTVPGSPKNFIFTFPADIANALAEQGNFIVALGNNHILNQGRTGVTSTKQALDEAGIPHFGWTSLETEPSQRVRLLEVSGTTFAFANYNQFLPEGYETALVDLAWAETQPNVAATILVPHWGNEYQPKANDVIRDWAAEFVAAGADLIVGGHPHVVQDFAEISGTPVYFSLGNAVFDQYFSPETMAGLAVSATFDPKTKSWQFKKLPLTIERNGQTHLSDESR